MTTPPVGQFGPHPSEVAFRNLMQRQAYSAVRISGAEVSHWNGKFAETTGGPAGVAHWDGSIGYDKAAVTARLRHMMYDAGRLHDTQTLAGFRESIRIMLHENSHLLSRAGETWADSTAPYQQPHVKALEEGVTEAWAQAHTNDYIRDLGLDRVAPGITNIPAGDAYPQYTPAVRALCHGLGHNMGVPEGEVLRRLNNESARGKWQAVADMVMDSSGLRQQIADPAAQNAARDQIQQAMQSQFAHLPDIYDRSNPSDANGFQNMQVASAAAGNQAIQQAQYQVNALRYQYAPRPPGPDPNRQVGPAPGPAHPGPGPEPQVFVGRAPVPPRPSGPDPRLNGGTDPRLNGGPDPRLNGGPAHGSPDGPGPDGHPPLSEDMRRAAAAAQTGVAPMAGARPIGPVRSADGARPPQTDRGTQRTGPEPGD